MLDHLADLESDFSAIHGVHDMYRLGGPRFLAMAWRISAYEGVMRLRIVEWARQSVPPVDGAGPLLAGVDDVATAHTLRQALGSVPPDARVVEVPAEELLRGGGF